MWIKPYCPIFKQETMNNYKLTQTGNRLTLQPHTDFVKRYKQFAFGGVAFGLATLLIPTTIAMKALLGFTAVCLLGQALYDWYQTKITIVFDKSTKMIYKEISGNQKPLLSFDEAEISSIKINNRRFYYSLVPQKDRYQRGTAISHFYSVKNIADIQQYENEILPVIKKFMSQ